MHDQLVDVGYPPYAESKESTLQSLQLLQSQIHAGLQLYTVCMLFVCCVIIFSIVFSSVYVRRPGCTCVRVCVGLCV